MRQGCGARRGDLRYFIMKLARSRQQQSFVFRTWGGARKGAGRPPHGEKAMACHLRRPMLAHRFPVHVTWRMRREVWNLRARRCLSVLQQAFWASIKPGFRVVHYSVMGNHVHLMVEAGDER